MKELNFSEVNSVSGGMSNLSTFLLSTGVGTGMGALAGFGFSSGGLTYPILGGVLGGMAGSTFGLVIVFGAAAIKFATAEISI
ncbi:hypothetical protein [Candidatus Berkiella aquae]|uniref:Bacteriocin class II with double-glycine leader peptide n=1 Tax=Candidatus Berkiella aquae TaxID=295108 RepID=A0A0Q9Z0C6_9GAMM|nr:hypothetical protein [Candidatus Berkiella aquae]MCS5712148.1 hypothetical protein [Candidatus Berkiella aquae]